jgi:hypothetical protein
MEMKTMMMRSTMEVSMNTLSKSIKMETSALVVMDKKKKRPWAMMQSQVMKNKHFKNVAYLKLMYFKN